MSNNTKIEWADCTINPFVGCTKCSPGCDNCYAEKIAMRMVHNPQVAHLYEGTADKDGWTGQILFNGGQFNKVAGWKKPRRIFVGSMTDCFHENMREDCLFHILDKIRQYPKHTFIMLTKRPQIMQSMIDTYTHELKEMGGVYCIPNLWLGVTVCNQQEANEKIPVLLDTPATKRFVSVEPMLGAVDLLTDFCYGTLFPLAALDWVICGGETGQKARPMDLDWARSLRDQCVTASTPFFFKSSGGKGKTDLLDGVAWTQFPEGEND